MIKTIFYFFSKLLKKLSLWLSYINLRFLVLIFGLMYILVPNKLESINLIDNFILKISTLFLEAPHESSGIAIVEVPHSEFESWYSDIYSSNNLSVLIANVIHSSSATIGLVLDEPLDEGVGGADRFLEASLANELIKTKSKFYQEAEAFLQRKAFLMDILKDDRIIVGVSGTYFKGQKPIAGRVNDELFGLQELQQYLWPNCLGCAQENLNVLLPRPNINHYTILSSHWPYRNLFYSHEEDQIHAGFLARYLSVSANKSSKKTIYADINGLSPSIVSLSDLQLAVSPDGRFIGFHGLTERMVPIIEKIPFSEALARRAFPDKVIIAKADDPLADNLALNIYSLDKDATISTPGWFSAGLKLLWLSILIYLVFLVVRISYRFSIAISLFLTLVFFVAQLSLIVAQKSWIPLGQTIVLLWLGEILIVVWKHHNSRYTELQERADRACIAHADMLIEDEKLDEASQMLIENASSPLMLDKMYDVAEIYNRQKNYMQAYQLLRELKNRTKKYRDVDQRLEVTRAMLTPEELGESTSGGLEKTAVLVPTLNESPKTLGRYEIIEEIGRGAMGTVYLGFDPRIARKVAIKTLNYEQFSASQINQIKDRFFREAEAAGRLSHPTIISVFDVGEEENRAFIAMDYAEGKPLNCFVEKDNLLPVFEVYRIVCDVAEALEFAHTNNIVHRDIKPGNIIYNPSPYQVKVTDFGIARIMDDSKTSTGEILGSPLYMAPEQLKGKKVNREADVFSLGVTFYQLLCGDLPFKGENLAALTYEIIHGRHKSVRSVRKDLPASAARIINQALQKSPADRYESAAELLVVLKKSIKRDFPILAKRAGIV